MTDQLTLTRPDDWHLHLRDGEALRSVLPDTARRFGRAIVMPNLKPPVRVVDEAAAYRERILAALPAGTVESLLRPENKATLTKILTYHVVAGKLTSTDIVAAIKAGGGNATLTTVACEKLSARLSGNSVVITDGKGGQSTVTAVDLMQSNGVVHVIDSVLLP